MSRYALKNGIAVLTASNPPVNGLSKAVREGFLKGLEQAKKDGAKAVVVIGEGKTFPAGADIAEFATGKWRDDPDLMKVVETFDKSEIPLVAAIHGTALGGGLESCLACNYRVALPSAKVGLPECLLGILPGAGGCVRLPRVVGVEKALQMITTGAPIGAKDAHKLGIVDQLIDGKTEADLLEGAIKFAASIADKKEHPRISSKTIQPVDSSVYEEARSTMKKKARGQVAPQVIVDCIESIAKSPTFEQGDKVEKTNFEKLLAGNQAKAMQHMFFAERECGKVPGVNPKSAQPMKKVGVIGAGTMGRGIAMCFINRGIPVVLSETNEEALDGGIKAIEDLYKKSSAFRNGKMSESDLQARLNLITRSLDPTFDAMRDVDGVIEAVFENMNLKKDIFQRLGKVCKDEAMLCTNTSYLNIDEIANASGRPEKVVGAHFFSPANIMPLLEAIRGTKSDPSTLASVMGMGRTIGKTTVLAGNCFGFIGNRMLENYIQQAVCLLEEGATARDVDQPFFELGLPMGPLALLDLAGNDVPYRVRKEATYPFKPENVKGSRGKSWMALADGLVDAGRLGQKTGKGWYAYQGRKGEVDPEVTNMCKVHAEKFGIEQRKHTKQDVVERCLYPLINEGFKILEEGIATRPGDVDVVWNAGYGFPRYQGGPMWYGDQIVGLKNVVQALNKHYEQNPQLPEHHFKPSALLEQLAKEGKTLQQYWKTK